MNEEKYLGKMGAIYQMNRQRMYAAIVAEMMKAEEFALQNAYRFDGNHSWYVLGDVFFKMKDYAMAVKAFQKSLKCRPDDEDALMALGNSYSEMGKPEWAERSFRKGLLLNPANMGMRFNLANALFDQQKFDLAQAEYLAVLNAGGPLTQKARRMVGIVKAKLRPPSAQAGDAL